MNPRELVVQALDGFLKGPEAGRFRGFALNLCQNRVQAEELEQEACRRALAGAERYDPSRPFSNWVMSILNNTAADFRRSAAFRLVVSLDMEKPGTDQTFTEGLSDGLPSILEQLEKVERLEQLHRAVESLPDTYRAILTLCDIEEVSYEEAARRLGVPLGTVRSRLARARSALCRLMKSYL